MGLLIKGPSVSALPFRDDRGRTTIAITTGLLHLNLSTEEADSVMAQSISRILIGDVLSRNDPAAPATLTLYLTLECAFIALLSITFHSLASEGAQFSPLFLVAFGCVLAMAPLANFIKKRFRLIRSHDQLLSDSIAAKITSNPAALRRSLEKIHTGGLDYVLRAEASYTLQAQRRDLEAKTPVVRPYIMTMPAEGSSEERLDNLRNIERGSWRTFSQRAPMQAPVNVEADRSEWK